MYRVEVDTNERCVYLNMMRAYNATANDLPAPMLLVRSGDHFLCAGLIFVFLADEDGGNARVELIVRPEATEGEQLDGKSS
jgi:hypothetical protein